VLTRHKACEHLYIVTLQMTTAMTTLVDPQLTFDLMRGLWQVATWNGHSRGVSASKLSAIADSRAGWCYGGTEEDC